MNRLFRAIFSLNDPGWGRGNNTPAPSGDASSDPQPKDGSGGDASPGARLPERDLSPKGAPLNSNRPRGSKDGPPDLDELWKDFNRKLNGFFGKGKGQAPRPQGSGGNDGGGTGGGTPGGLRGAGIGAGVIVLGALLLWLASGVFIVQEGQTAAILRFGELDRTQDQAGITWRLPFPIEAHEVINTQQLRTVEVGYRQVPKNKLANAHPGSKHCGHASCGSVSNQRCQSFLFQQQHQWQSRRVSSPSS
jgi:modulator of FtsH protease HflK